VVARVAAGASAAAVGFGEARVSESCHCELRSVGLASVSPLVAVSVTRELHVVVVVRLLVAMAALAACGARCGPLATTAK
jgi:hypothetical protein